MKNYYLITVLTLLAGFPPLAIDMYLPAFTIIAHDLNEPYSLVQLSLTLFLFGYAIAQLLFGVLSDRFGRKIVLLSGVILFIIGSLLCNEATSILNFYIARLVQSIGAGSGAVISIAIVKDLFEHKERVRYLSIIASIMGLAPVIAPTIGGHLTIWFGWRTIFLFLALIGSITLISLTRVAESNHNKIKIGLKQLTRNYKELLKNTSFLAATLSNAFGFSAMFVFIASSPKIYISHFKIPVESFGYLFAINAAAFMLGNITSLRLNDKVSSRILNIWGAGLIFIGGCLLLITNIFINSIFAVLVPMLFATYGVGIVLPTATANAIAAITKFIGQASSLIACAQFGMAGLITVLVACIQVNNGFTLGILVLFCGTVSSISAFNIKNIKK